jgi:hypothetical protein
MSHTVELGTVTPAQVSLQARGRARRSAVPWVSLHHHPHPPAAQTRRWKFLITNYIVFSIKQNLFPKIDLPRQMSKWTNKANMTSLPHGPNEFNTQRQNTKS